MLWAAGKPGALLKALAPRIAGWARRAAPLEANPAGTSPADTAKATADTPPSEAPDALRLPPEIEKPLLDAGMPAEGSTIYEGQKRAADTPEGAARKFVMWARAVGATGTFAESTVSALYWECAEVDHREPVAIDRFLRALKNARGIRQDASATDRRQLVWTIEPPEPKRIPRAQAAVAARVAANSPQLHARVLQRSAPEQDYSSPQLMQATAHDARRQGRARKQRGSRNVRWVA